MAFKTTVFCGLLASQALAAPAITEPRSLNKGMHLKIMPLGASITYGTDSTDGNGYRSDLQQLLEKNGNQVSMVGTVNHGTMHNNACEAYPGKLIYQVNDLALKSGAYDYKPNVITVHVGTNDCIGTKGNVPSDIEGRYSNLFGNIHTHAPGALTVVSSLIKNRDATQIQCIEKINAALPKTVRDAQAKGQNVVLVDMYDVVPLSDINAKDKTHPNDAGYDLMAKAWYEALVKNASRIKAADPKGKPAPN